MTAPQAPRLTGPCVGAASSGLACARIFMALHFDECQALGMIDSFAKEYLHDELKWARVSLVGKVDGLSEYDVRRPLTKTGTNLLGLVKHLTLSVSPLFRVDLRSPLPWIGPEFR